MKRSRNVIFLLLAGLLLLLQGSLAYAADGSSAAVTVSVRQVFTVTSGTAPSDTFTYSFTAVDKKNPMPEGSTEGSYTFSMQGNKGAEIGPISFTAPGTYAYKLEPVVTDKKEEYTCAEDSYEISIYVTASAEQGLTATVIAENKEGKKVKDIRFINAYAGKVTPQKPSVPDNPSAGTPTSPQKPASPTKTGDPTDISAMLLLCAVSLGAVVVVFVLKRKEKTSQETGE